MPQIFVLSIFIFLIFSFNSLASPALWKIQWRNTDFSKSSVNFDEIISGGPPKDGIPSIDHPQFLEASKINNLADTEPVISVAIDGTAKAYPLRILTWHEIVNDTISDIPIIVTYCPLCNASAIFDRRINGKESQFGVSGKLLHSDMIMYDRNSDSWWQQYTGKAIVGKHTGIKLKKIASRTESFAKFKQRFPNSPVLIPNNPHQRSYGANPYIGYDSSTIPFLYKGKYEGSVPQMTYVVVVEDEAWTLNMVKEEKAITTDKFTITWEKGQNSALDTKYIAKGRDIGNVTVTNKYSKDIPYSVTFAFVYKAFNPNGFIYDLAKE